jgi:hypothetical protein
VRCTVPHEDATVSVCACPGHTKSKEFGRATIGAMIGRTTRHTIEGAGSIGGKLG